MPSYNQCLEEYISLPKCQNKVLMDTKITPFSAENKAFFHKPTERIKETMKQKQSNKDAGAHIQSSRRGRGIKKNNKKPYSRALMQNHTYLYSDVKTPTITLSGNSSARHSQNKETKATIGHRILYEPHESLPAYGRPAVNLWFL